MLSERRRRILTALVKEYIHSAHPVGSRSLVDRYGLDCSAATVRNDLAALEASGHVYQPHVSAGRVPTDTGYRAFVDEVRSAIDDEGILPKDIETVHTRLAQVESELADLMRESASLLARLTNYAAIVLAPTLQKSRIRRIDLVPLAPAKVLIVLITDTGQVAKRLAEIGEPVSEDEVAKIEATLNHLLGGRQADDLSDLREDLLGSGQRVAVWLELVDELLTCLTETDETSLYHGGTAALLEEPEFEDPEMVRSIVGLLEDGILLARTFTEAGRAKNVLVRIGHENRLDELGHMSVVVAPYGSAGTEGFVGLLGPTRMDYDRAIRSVRCVADGLTQTFGPVDE